MREQRISGGEHGISQQTWFEYLEGSLPPAERARVDEHLDSCAPCRRLHHEIRVWERVIREEASRLTAARDLAADEIDRLAASALHRIRETEPPAIAVPGVEFGEAVLLLRNVLDPLCGEGAARNAVRAAKERSAENWDAFVRCLGAAIGAVYGAPARVLVEHVGGLAGAGVR